MAAQRYLPGGGQAEAIIGKDHEILDESLGESNQPELFKTDNPDQIREHYYRKNIINALEGRERDEVLKDSFSLFVRYMFVLHFTNLLFKPGKVNGIMIKIMLKSTYGRY